MSKRPSLNALRAFEATVRLRSMSAAAEELLVTHGAVSRHAKSLETMFGVPLLDRSSRTIRATPDGEHLAQDLSRAFTIITTSLERLQPGPLTLSCSSTIMMNWLIPRIAAFHSAHPDVELRLNINYGRVDFVHDEISVAIRNSMIPPPKDVVISPLLDEWVGPVCSPEYLAASGIERPRDLGRCILLSSKTRADGWDTWMTIQPHGPFKLPHLTQYEHFYLQIQAAICDLGVAMAPKFLVQDYVQSGKLVAPFGFVAGAHKLVLWVSPHLRTRPDTRALVDWLTAEFRRSAKGDPALAGPRSRR